MTGADLRALKALAQWAGTLARPGSIGDELWGCGRRSGNCSAPYARQAGKVLVRLEALGLAQYTIDAESGGSGWEITSLGRSELQRKVS